MKTVLAGLAAACILGLSSQPEGKAAPWQPPGAPQAPGLVQQALTFKDCQRIKRCASRRCAAHWRCRECDYKRVCRQGRCEWIDVCVWGPYRLVLPQGAFPG